MAERANWFYWDTSVFLSYFNQNPDRHASIDAVLSYIRSTNGDRLIVTSTFTKVEVSYYQDELGGQLSPDTEEIFDLFWNDRAIMRFVDLTSEIARRARHLKRVVRSSGHKLETPDAIHLASAAFGGVAEMHSYDGPGHLRFDGQMTFRICQPRVIPGHQPGLL
ncbi:MAG: type II toxin-antitoxin system VapC family toxin [Candidatus Tectomicrobia bacterium]